MKNIILPAAILLSLLGTVACKKGTTVPSIETTADTMAASVNGMPIYSMGFTFSANSINSKVSELDMFGFNDSEGIDIHLMDYHGVGYYPFTGVDSAHYFTLTSFTTTNDFVAHAGGITVTKATNAYIQGIFSFSAGPYNISNGIFNIAQ